MAVLEIASSKTTGKDALRNVLKYAFKDSKTPDKICSINGFFPYDEINEKTVAKSFSANRRRWNKKQGNRRCLHLVASYHKDEPITPEEAMQIAREFSDKTFPNHQVLIVAHQDTDHVHVHIVVDPVNYLNGKMLHTQQNVLDKKWRPNHDKFVAAHGFKITEKGKDFYGYDLNKGYNPDTVSATGKKQRAITEKPFPKSQDDSNILLLKLLLAILEALIFSKNLSDFKRRLERAKWKYDDSKKHATFTYTGKVSPNIKKTKFRVENIDKTFGEKFKYVFGKDFTLDKEHISSFLGIRQLEREFEYRSTYERLLKIESDFAWNPMGGSNGAGDKIIPKNTSKGHTQTKWTPPDDIDR